MFSICLLHEQRARCRLQPIWHASQYLLRAVVIFKPPPILINVSDVVATDVLTYPGDPESAATNVYARAQYAPRPLRYMVPVEAPYEFPSDYSSSMIAPPLHKKHAAVLAAPLQDYLFASRFERHLQVVEVYAAGGRSLVQPTRENCGIVRRALHMDAPIGNTLAGL